MDLAKRIKDSIGYHLEEDQHRLVEFGSTQVEIEGAKATPWQHSTAFEQGFETLLNTATKENPKMVKSLEALRTMTMKTVAEEIGGINLEIFINKLSRGCEVFLPVSKDNPTEIEAALIGYAAQGAGKIKGATSINGYMVLVCSPSAAKMGEHLGRDSNLGSAGVILEPVIGEIPSGFAMADVAQLDKTLTHSDVKYGILTTNQTSRQMFPGYKKPFWVTDGNVVFEAQMTSRNAGTKHPGNYIGTTGTGGLGKYMQAHDLEKGSNLHIVELVPKKVYMIRESMV